MMLTRNCLPAASRPAPFPSTTPSHRPHPAGFGVPTESRWVADSPIVELSVNSCINGTITPQQSSSRQTRVSAALDPERRRRAFVATMIVVRSEEDTSELQARTDLV